MSAHVLLNFLNELRKVQMRLADHFIAFRNKCNKLNNTGA